MALVMATFETTLKNIFAMMLDGSKTDAWMAEQIAAAIKTYAGSGQVTTTDSGTAPAGTYVGAGVGTMVINADDLKSKLRKTFETAYTNDDLAVHMASDIDDVCKADDTVTTISSGIVTTSDGTSPFSGQGIGIFTGIKTTIETILKACFATMNNMSKGGDDYFAARFAAAIDSYLKAGKISVTLRSPFVSGVGKGALT